MKGWNAAVTVILIRTSAPCLLGWQSKNYAPAARAVRAYFRTALSMPGAAFFKSSRFIAGCNSTFALNARNHGSAMAGICDESAMLRKTNAVLAPFSSAK